MTPMGATGLQTFTRVTGVCVGDPVAVFPEVEAMPAAAGTRAYFGDGDLPDHVRGRARCGPEANGEERQRW
jgi:hypothetical protein